MKPEVVGKVEAGFGPASSWGSWLNGAGREFVNLLSKALTGSRSLFHPW